MATSKIQKTTPSWEYVGNVYWWDGSWTCPADGFIELNVAPNANNWYWYIYDSSSPTGWSHCMAGANQGQQTMVVPAKKGATFSSAMGNGLGTVQAFYYKFV